MVTKFERFFFQPKVYKTFTTRDNEEFIIQDLPEDKFDEAVKFMIEYYAKEETFLKASKVSEKVLMDFYQFILKQKCTIACIKKDTNELVGLNVLSVKSRGLDTNFKVIRREDLLIRYLIVLLFQTNDEALKKLRDLFGFIMNFYDVFGHYNVNYFLYAHGLAVKSEYRGKGIASELLDARVSFMKTHNLSVTTSIFTTSGGQKAAEKIGFSDNFSISYEILQNIFKDFNFSCANAANCKISSLKI